ncbi:MAG: polysaccharide deacetylase family protein [Planctomycetes bacterium]|nr:polysaccharide deacetylase family protein [Planctomycetota bacterium]
MKKLLLAFAAGAGLGAAAMAADICVIPEGRESGLTITYDDGAHTHYTHALPTHVKHKVPGTFIIITDRVEDDADPARPKKYVSWNELKEMQDKGMEIATHTKSHRNMRDIESKGITKEMTKGKSRQEVFAMREKNYPELLAEVADSVKALTDHGLEQPRTIAFAGNACPDWTWRLIGDTCPMALRRPNLATGRGDTPARYDKALAEKLKPGQIVVAMVHGLGTKTPDDGWNPPDDFATYEHLIQKAGELHASGKVYVGKHGDLMRYHERAKGCRLKDNKDGTFTIVTANGKTPQGPAWELWLRAAPGEKIKVNGKDAAPDERGVFTARLGDVLTITK